MVELPAITKKRGLLLAMVIVLIILSTIILRSHWKYTAQLAKLEVDIKSKAKKALPCENYTSLSRCERCPKDELRNLVSYCMQTGYKESIRCDHGKEEFIWCDISPAVEESDFWRFQLKMLLFGLASYTVVYLRQQKLDKILMEKINKQISADV